MTEITMEIELQPFQTPNFVIAKVAPRPRQDGLVEAPKWPLKEIDLSFFLRCAMSSGLKSFASRDNLIHELLVSRTAPRRSRDEPANDLPTVQPTRESLARE